jgi:EKC/KEOPS complex subunit CGI121/TPRKB
MTAILTTLLLALPAGSDDPSPKTRSHNLHSEILLTLHTNNIISEAIKKFGISNSTTSLLVVRFGDGEQDEVWDTMDGVVEGELVPLSTLDGGELVDWKALDKVCRTLFRAHRIAQSSQTGHG